MNRTERIKQEATALYHPTCDVCGLSFTEEEWNNRHTGHEPGCPNAQVEAMLNNPAMDINDLPDDLLYCNCDINYHSDCCPTCQKGSDHD